VNAAEVVLDGRGGAPPRTTPAVRAPPRRVVVLSTDDELSAALPRWREMHPGPGADPEVLLAVARARPAVLRPHVLALLAGETIEALLVGRIEEHDYRCRFGYRTVYARRLRTLVVDHGGMLRAHEGVSPAPLVRAAVDAVKGGVATAVYLRRLEVGSELLRVVRATVRRPWRNESEAPVPHWRLDLPAAFDDLLRRTGGRTRQTLRRGPRALRRAFPGRVVVRKTTRERDVPDFCRRAEAVARCTYQRGLGAGFVHDAEYEGRLRAQARRGSLRAYELVVDGRVLSFWIGELRDGVHHLDSTAFARDARRWSPGRVLRMEVLRDAVSEGAARMDYGFGDAEYKRQFRATCRLERDVYLFAPGALGAWLTGVRSAVTAASRVATALARWTRLRDPIRRATRDAARRRLAADEG